MENAMKKMILVVLSFLFSSCAYAEGSPELCLGKICLEQAKVNERTLVERFGEGRKRYGGGDDRSVVLRCYYDPKQNLWVEFTFDKNGQAFGTNLKQIFVTNEQHCPKNFIPKVSFEKMETEAGIAVGSTQQHIVRIKGKPTSISPKVQNYQGSIDEYFSGHYGEMEYSYEYSERNENENNVYFVTDGKVKSIWISNDE